MRLEDKEMLNVTYDYFAPRFSFPPRINMAGVRDTYGFYAEKEADSTTAKPAKSLSTTRLWMNWRRKGFLRSWAELKEIATCSCSWFVFVNPLRTGFATTSHEHDTFFY